MRVDPPLCRGTSKGNYSSCAKGRVRLGEIVGKIGEVVKEILWLWTVSGAARNETRHVDDNCLRHKDVQSWAFQLLSHACSRDEMWSLLCHSVRVVFVGVLFTHPVGWLEVFLQATEPSPDSDKKSQIVRPWRMLRVRTARLPMGSIPMRWRWRSCRQVSPRLFVEPPACFRVNREVEFFDSFELLFFSLSNLWIARDGSVVSLSPCQVLVVQSFAFSFRLSKVGSLIEWLLEVLLHLTWESNASNFKFSLLLLRRGHVSPRQFDRIALCLFLSTRFLRFAGVPSRKYRWVVSVFFLTCLFWASVSLCCTFFVFLQVRVWPHDCCSSWWHSQGLRWRRSCSARTLLVSAKISYFFHNCSRYPDSPAGIALQTLLFVGIFAQFEDLCVVHVSE